MVIFIIIFYFFLHTFKTTESNRVV